MSSSGERHDLDLLIKSRTPIIVIETFDEPQAVELVREIGIRRFRPVFLWTITEGLRRQDIDAGEDSGSTEPEQALRRVKGSADDGIYVLADLHPFLRDPLHVRLLKDIALRHEQTGQTLVLISHQLDIPDELERLSARAEIALPDSAELENIVRAVAAEWRRRHQSPVTTDTETFQLLIRSLKGMTGNDARRLARGAIFNDGAINHSDITAVVKAKHALLSPGGILSFEYDTAGFSDVGGLSRMKVWLEQRREAFVAGTAGEDRPRGMLLLGVQGGGKSLAAKAVAGVWQVPLMRMDFGAIYNKYHGESERNLRESLKTAEAMAPCVLWIDEIEKGISVGDGDGGTSQRILGTLLTWMAERKAPVFLVATANDISRLPAELVRKGRFDEVFFVDLPSRSVRETIFAIHLRKRGLDPDAFDLIHLAAITAGFSGAEIEQSVVDALYSSRARDAEPTTAEVENAILQTRTLSVLMAEKLEALRAWAAERAVPADESDET